MYCKGKYDFVFILNSKQILFCNAYDKKVKEIRFNCMIQAFDENGMRLLQSARRRCRCIHLLLLSAHHIDCKFVVVLHMKIGSVEINNTLTHTKYTSFLTRCFERCYKMRCILHNSTKTRSHTKIRNFQTASNICILYTK